MAISDKQAAAISRRKREQAIERDRQFQQRVTGNLMGFEDAKPVQDQVGWAEQAPGSIKGEAHLCFGCSPLKPSATAYVVTKNLLAARMPCRICGLKLEDWDPEKK